MNRDAYTCEGCGKTRWMKTHGVVCLCPDCGNDIKRIYRLYNARALASVRVRALTVYGFVKELWKHYGRTGFLKITEPRGPVESGNDKALHDVRGRGPAQRRS